MQIEAQTVGMAQKEPRTQRKKREKTPSNNK